MNFLILGSEGQLGKSIANSGSFKEHNLYCFDKPEADITDKSVIDGLFKRFSIDVVINCAAYTNVDRSETDREETFAVNVEGVRNIAQCAAVYGAVMVHISTDFVFDGKKGSPYTEDDSLNPLNFYGETKAKSEEAVLDTLDKYYIIRTSSMYSSIGRNFVKAIIENGRIREEIRVVSDQISSPTNSDDLAEAIIRLIETGKYGIYHFADSGSCSKYEMAAFIAEYCRLPAAVKPCATSELNSEAERPANSVLDCGKYISVTGYTPPPWKASLEKFLETHRYMYENR